MISYIRKHKRMFMGFIITIIFIVIGWMKFPNYIVIPNIFDHVLSWAFCNSGIFSKVAYDAERRIGARGSLFFIKLGLTSYNRTKVEYTFIAINELRANKQYKCINRQLFDWFVNEFKNGIYQDDGGYKMRSIRERSLRYLFSEENVQYTIRDKENLLDIYNNRLSHEEKSFISKLVPSFKTWFHENNPDL